MTEFETDLIANTSSMRRLMRWFGLSSLAVVFGVGGWAATAKIDSAVVTAGTFVVQSNAQAVQHPEGGVVGAILVHEGQLVQEGQVVVRLDGAKILADESINERELISLAAEKARLEAERQDRTTVEPPIIPGLSVEAARTLRAALAGQQSILDERRSTRASQISQLEERKRQAKTQIDGLNERYKAIKEELDQASGELADLRTLDSKGLVRRPVLRQAERDVSRVRGDAGDTEARIAGAQSQLVEADLKIADVTRNARTEILTRLQTVTDKLAEAEEQHRAAFDRLQRLEIRAPRTGYVNELSVHTVGGVAGAGQKLMSIIPSTEPLIVSAKIPPEEVDQVHVGQPATIRISAFKLPVAPELEGEVTVVSPDQVVDSQSGRAFFKVTVAMAPGESGKLDGKELTPGLPAEVLLRGESRRAITYLTQPLTDKLTLAFREK